MMKHITVVAGIIKYDNKYLCAQRNYSKYDYISYKFEFPGGKIEVGETETIALHREILEELGVEIHVQKKLAFIEHEYTDFKITMHCYLCSILNLDIKLNEHIKYIWATKAEMEHLDWAAADMPILNLID